MTRRTVVALVLAVSACTPATPPRPSAPSTTPPSTFGPPDAVLRSSGLVKVLPDTCQAVKPFLLPEMYEGQLFDSYAVTGDDDREECRWSSFRSTRAHLFGYSYTRFASRDGALQEMGQMRRGTFLLGDPCHYGGVKVTDIVGLGAAAFAVPCAMRKYEPGYPYTDRHAYEMRGLELDVAVRNVVVQIEWVAAEYPAAIARKYPHWLHGGKGLPHSYDEALAFVDRVAWNVLAHIP
jgi:hypothetical protein